MRYTPLLVFILFFQPAFSQLKKLSKVDEHAAVTGYYTIDTLHNKLALPSYSDSEKVRSFFYWLTQHISYDVEEFHKSRYAPPVIFERIDSLGVMKIYEESYGAYVLKRKKGVCAGYATVFKLLCDRSKIECAIVEGSGKTDPTSIGEIIDVNHAWNAVKLNGKWYLLDVCWSSGYCDGKVTKFTRMLNESYYLTPPELLIFDHYPTDNRWLLLDKPPTKKEFEHFPALLSRKSRFKFDSNSAIGILSCRVGDTLKIGLDILTENAPNIKYPSRIFEYDRLGRRMKYSNANTTQTFSKVGNRLTYTYRVCSDKISLLYLSYGSEYLAGYKLQFK